MNQEKEPTDEWLEKTNEKFNREDVPPQLRAMEAIRRWTIEFQDPIVIPSARADKVFEWFGERVNPELQQIGSRFTGSFYFESAFYPVSFPVFFGTKQLDGWSFLETMPDAIKARLSGNAAEFKKYTELVADGLDYIQGYETLDNASALNPFARELMASAH